VIGLDTETRRADGERDIQVMRCWAATRIDRPGGLSAPESRVDASGHTPQGLAAQVDLWTRGRDTVWVYAHNVGFDLAVTRLPVELCALGWTVSDFALDGRSPWIRLAKGRSRITVADSWSWVARGLATIGPAVGVVKPPLPADDDDPATWDRRCRADVDILMAMMCQLMDWWARTGRGRWSITGAASGWNAFRHTETPYRVVIETEPERVAFDRKAIYGGKRYVNRVGKLTPGGYAEVDFERAYTTIARDMPLPFQRMRDFDSLSITDERVESDRWGIIAECEISTSVPRWPKRDNGRVWYPVGRFRTTLAGPDILAARNCGALLSIGRGTTYRLAPHMRPWALWCLDIANNASGDTPEIVMMAAKQWGRSVIGKWAQKGYARIALGPAPTIGWAYEETWMADTHVRGSIVDIGGTRHLCYLDGDGENSFPAVLAFVEAHVRVRLNTAIDAIGRGAFVQCDTDGILTSINQLIARIRKAGTLSEARDKGTDVVNVIMDKVSALTEPLRLRVKSTYTRVEVIGPQHIRLDDSRRFSGIPGSAEELPDGRLGAWVWPKLAYQLAHGDGRGYVREFRQFRIPRALAAAWIGAEGEVYPVQYGQDATGRLRALPWAQTDAALGGAQLAVEQNGDVLRLIDHYENGEQ